MHQEELVAEEKLAASTQQTVVAEIAALRRDIQVLQAMLAKR
jgi:hypothetical protein